MIILVAMAAIILEYVVKPLQYSLDLDSGGEDLRISCYNNLTDNDIQVKRMEYIKNIGISLDLSEYVNDISKLTTANNIDKYTVEIQHEPLITAIYSNDIDKIVPLYYKVQNKFEFSIPSIYTTVDIEQLIKTKSPILKNRSENIHIDKIYYGTSTESILAYYNNKYVTLLTNCNTVDNTLTGLISFSTIKDGNQLLSNQLILSSNDKNIKQYYSNNPQLYPTPNTVDIVKYDEWNLHNGD